jgi:hypothetical protein
MEMQNEGDSRRQDERKPGLSVKVKAAGALVVTFVSAASLDST